MMGQPPFDRGFRKGIDYTVPAEEHREKEKIFWEDALKLLGSINDNTACLSTLVDLIADNKAKQEDIIKLFSDFLKVATIKENQKEARSMYRQVMDKIHEITEDADTILKLTSFGMLIGQALKANGII